MSLHEKFIIFTILSLMKDTSEEAHDKRKVLYNFLVSKSFQDAFGDEIQSLIKHGSIVDDDPLQQPYAIPRRKMRKFEKLADFHERVEKMTDRYLVRKMSLICSQVRHRLQSYTQFAQDHTDDVIMIIGQVDELFDKMYEASLASPADNET